MTAQSLRDLLLRAQRDVAFAELARTDPDTAAADYDLSPDELESLRRREGDLYYYLVGSLRADDMDMTLPPTTLTEPMRLTYHSFSDLFRGDQGIEAAEKRRELVEAIRTLSGAERRAKINELMEYV
ncbi:hypothetical protein ACFVVU_09215 [Kitasatospora sp. NPDC057965]|uniref:hypothetical protein n=1 Tax=Kitasatospora sp. NPDC057965 TaxID=3346291 RepID=UPI0036DB00D3